jgi:hypothetical protein
MAIPFEKMKAGQLNPGAIVPQALDNQWVPTNVLKSLSNRGKSLVDWKGRNKAVISEWRRSLIYAPQVIVNRAALINNSVVVEDYSGENKEHFQQLLSRRVIVDYLLTEETPDQRPTFEISDEKWFRWLDVIQDTNLACVRLDWGKQEDDFRNVAEVFHKYIQSLNMEGPVEHLTNAFKVSAKDRKNFRQKLLDVATYTFNIGSQGKNVTRNELYKEFVCVADTKIDHGYYDKTKPFAIPLKEIFDLRYTVNLPDALGRYAFTPKGSPDRTVLGDVNQLNLQNILHDNGVTRFIDSIKRMHFATISDGLYLRGLDTLSLGDVIEARGTDEWEKYTTSLNALLTTPLAFEDKIDNVATDFAKLNRKITELKIRNIKMSSEKIIALWHPEMMIVIAVGGAILRLSVDPANAALILVEELAGPIAIGVAPLAVNLKIAAEAYVDLGISVNFMRTKVNQGREAWGEIKGALQNDQRFKFIERKSEDATQDADQSKAESDPNDILG